MTFALRLRDALRRQGGEEEGNPLDLGGCWRVAFIRPLRESQPRPSANRRRSVDVSRTCYRVKERTRVRPSRIPGVDNPRGWNLFCENFPLPPRPTPRESTPLAGGSGPIAATDKNYRVIDHACPARVREFRRFTSRKSAIEGRPVRRDRVGDNWTERLYTADLVNCCCHELWSLFRGFFCWSWRESDYVTVQIRPNLGNRMIAICSTATDSVVLCIRSR